MPVVLLEWKEGEVWLHRPLPMFHHATQTSLSLICQQQPVIRIPLPAGSPAQDSRCDSAREQAADVPTVALNQTCSSPSLRGGYHGTGPHKQYLSAQPVRGIYMQL